MLVLRSGNAITMLMALVICVIVVDELNPDMAVVATVVMSSNRLKNKRKRDGSE